MHMSPDQDQRRGHDAFLDAVDADDAFYVECSNGHGSLPPRRACPHCGDQQLAERSLPETGRVQAHTVVHVPTEEFAGRAPYVTAIADFGPVTLTGLVVDSRAEDVENGMTVAVDTDETPEGDTSALVFVPR